MYTDLSKDSSKFLTEARNLVNGDKYIFLWVGAEIMGFVEINVAVTRRIMDFQPM